MACALAAILAAVVSFSTPCPVEDARGCYWDASQHGNSAGVSFLVLPDGVTYMSGVRIPPIG